MKYDINLLVKRKNTANRKKLLVRILIGTACVVVFVVAGIVLPAFSRFNAQVKLASLESSLSSSGVSEEELMSNTAYVDKLNEQKTDLEALQASRSDILAYLSTIENALPESARITTLSLSGNELQITGISPGDAEVAAFSLHLRQSGSFSSVFVSTSTAGDETTMFSLSATLPTSLGGEVQVLQSSETPVQDPAKEQNTTQEQIDDTQTQEDAQ